MTASSDYLHKLFNLDGLTAVVIGGTGVLGGAFAEALGGAGAHVVVVGRTLKTDADTGKTIVDKIVDAGGSSEFVKADSTSREDLEAIVAHLKAAGRETNVLINGAGTNSATPFFEITDEECDNILNTTCELCGWPARFSARRWSIVVRKVQSSTSRRSAVSCLCRESSLTPLRRARSSI